MEPQHRKIILRNLVPLTRIHNASSLYTELMARNVFTADMIESIQCSSRRNPREQLQQLFLDSCKRGPTAFKEIVQALEQTGNAVEARLLDPSAIYTIPCGDESSRSCCKDTTNLGRDSSTTGAPTFATSKPKFDIPTSVITTERAYKLTSIPVGFALIINVIDFDGNPDLRRDGAEKDALNLRMMLKNFGYEVFLVINPKKKDLLCPQNGILKTFTDRFSTRTVDSCIVTIMSHGEDNFWIQTSDCESMANEYAHLVHLWDDILPRFNNHHFPTMRNKPKLFIIQSCRGEREHRRVRLTSPAANCYPRRSQIRTDSGKHGVDQYYEHHPEFNHMILLQSTIPGYVTIRHEENGSPFIQILCQVFQQLGQYVPLADMVPVIARKLQDLPSEDGGPLTCTFKTIGYVKPFQLIS